MQWNNLGSKKDFQPLSEDPAQSPSLPGFFYNRSDILDAEKEKIFYKSWQIVAHVSQLDSPGDFVSAQIADENVFVIRGKDGKIRGFYNVCQHRAHELLEGQGHIEAVMVCPYHAWSYNTEGQLHSARHCGKQPNFDKANYGLVPIQVNEIMGFVFVNLDPEAQALEKLAGDMFEDMRANVPWWDEMVISPELSSQGSEGGTLDANWKVLAENCLECYHCDPSHPAYVDLIDMKTYDWELNGPWLKSFGNLKKSENKAYNVDPAEPCQVGIYWFLWPNIEISIVPGEKSLSAFTFYPVTLELTHSASIILTLPGETVKQDRIDYRWNLLWSEDVGICESVHRGLKSRGYHQGRFVIDPDLPGVSEYGAHHFQWRYAQVMGL
ncbi:MAG: aromatic ring-hydroxylating dioxygenase subunit alpha [Xenococcaceae cyanobacterium MO_234.B1]|nr:aromatic ring-hydroxylating dioxygenase subunit alpha [Xenococcaceae cyanobacterium MO_234.B1]